MSYPKLQYCPFCGSRLPDQQSIKFCPFCGGNLLSPDSEITQQKLDRGNSVEHSIPIELTKKAPTTSGSLGLEEFHAGKQDEKIIQQDEVVLKKVVMEQGTKVNFDTYNKANVGKIVDSEYYSIILKDAPNKPNLVRKLERVLLRGSFAIRLAVDTMPSLLIYKTKGNDIMYLNELLVQEQASTSMVVGDFNQQPIVEELFESFDRFEELSLQTQRTIKKMPITLWVGDCIRGVFPNCFMKNSKGIMVITNQSIYFLPDGLSTIGQRWFIRSYNILTTVARHDQCLEFTYKDEHVVTIDFVDQQQLHNAYQCIGQVILLSKWIV